MGMVFLLFLILFIPSRVLFIRVEGNRNVPANQILEAAENCGISFGVSRRSVRSERVKNKLLETMPQLQWAGINTKGCVAVVSVRERTSESSDEEEGFVSGIVAVRDGVIQSCTATRGNLLCAPGQAVRKGELLISGFTDCGLTILATSAEGEVFALTRQSACAVTPLTCLKKGSHGPARRKYSLIFGKKRINLWKDSGIWDTSCGRIYSEYYVTLPGGLVLPVAIAVEEIRPVDLQEREILPEEAEVLLKAQLTGYLTGQMIAGQVISREEMLSGSGVYKLAGEYVCTEMIGREQRN
jgi:sporulation protein YqfD